jgi:hypothetical protein
MGAFIVNQATLPCEPLAWEAAEVRRFPSLYLVEVTLHGRGEEGLAGEAMIQERV